MQTIHTFTLALQPEQVIRAPLDAQFLSVWFHGDAIHLYVLMDPIDTDYDHTIWLCGSGSPMVDGGRFIGTIPGESPGQPIIHVFRSSPKLQTPRIKNARI
jgi:hypothetical protein